MLRRKNKVAQKGKKSKMNYFLFCVRRESNPGPIEAAKYFRVLATMDFTTKPQTLLCCWMTNKCLLTIILLTFFFGNQGRGWGVARDNLDDPRAMGIARCM
jgi:hypothetical protein